MAGIRLCPARSQITANGGGASPPTAARASQPARIDRRRRSRWLATAKSLVRGAKGYSPPSARLSRRSFATPPTDARPLRATRAGSSGSPRMPRRINVASISTASRAPARRNCDPPLRLSRRAVERIETVSLNPAFRRAPAAMTPRCSC